MPRAKFFKNGHRTINIRPGLYDLIAQDADERQPRQFPAQVLEEIVVKHYKITEKTDEE